MPVMMRQARLATSTKALWIMVARIRAGHEKELPADRPAQLGDHQLI